MTALSGASTASVVKRNILGRGCDPARAAFAKKAWEPVLGCNIDTATSDQELKHFLTTKKYSVFFIAPGQCALIKMGRVDGEGANSSASVLAATRSNHASRAYESLRFWPVDGGTASLTEASFATQG